ncbi:P-loop NTPase family protein [Nocardioides okcheonensis]|uniref:hypothetical protein n=1 Tax=Nocardioides okcheonensis TaxID=2894081 RepID=UPI001E38AFF4|nr:hypothetical protein [Nocardioides okcheonensis]UFN45213.1 hypothetical protein LN652_03075 [Nocardioides okcheonensis]
MALVVVFSAGGSPGASTTALGLAFAWHRPVLLVDADPSGASAVFAGYLRGTQAPGGGLIRLALAQRDGELAAVLPHETLVLDPPPHHHPLGTSATAATGAAVGSVWFLAGIRDHRQAPSVVALWEPLVEQLRAMNDQGQDVIVDAGRLGLAGSPRELILGADLALLVTRTSLPALAAVRSYADTLREDFAALGGGHRTGILAVDERRRWPIQVDGIPPVRPYMPRQIEKALKLPVVSTLPWAPDAAAVYSHGARPPRKFAGSTLLASYRAAAGAITSHIAARPDLPKPTSAVTAAAPLTAGRS